MTKHTYVRDTAVARGRFGRFAGLASAGLRMGASKLGRNNVASVIGQTADALGTMRGLGAKVGQMASYLDGFMPAEQSELYESVMGRLRAATTASPSSAIRAVVEEDLRASIGEMFADWEDEPVASASLGQVHRARLHDERVVAVKVQHPGIDEAFGNDLKNLASLEGVLRPIVGQKIDSKEVVSVLCDRFREELDYELEAERQILFANLHRDDPAIVVPEVIRERSSRRVLTSAFVEGMTLEEAAREGEAVRREYAEALWRFVFRGNFVGRLFNADPHPGNYIFHSGGEVTFLDFGCVQPLTDHMYRFGLAQYRSAVRGDEEAFAEATAAFYRTDQAPLVQHTRRCFEPLFSSPFRISREYARELLQESGALPRKLKGRSEAPPELPLLNRLQFGFYSVLARLDVAADYAGASSEVLSELALRESGAVAAASQGLDSEVSSP